MLRLNNQPDGRLVDIVGRNREREFGENESHEDLELNHGQVLTEAFPGSHPKGHVEVWKLTSAGDSVGESLGVELVRVWTPVVGVCVKRQDHCPNIHAFGDRDVAEYHVLERLARHH